MKFRNDIQGLRAIAVVTVIIYHLGNLPNGYLGVDMFFVISGFLITGILFRDFINNKYSIKEFYIRRFRRIIPLVLFVNLVVLLLGFFIMLPDDYENLAQSVIATNFFSNNVLAFITVGDYWAVINEFKPLMHTWSLGVEEQYYIIFPLIFFVISRKKSSLYWVLSLLTIASLLYFIIETNEAYKFYMLPTRFFEISIGGLAALKINEIKKNSIVANFSFIILITVLLFDVQLSNEIKIIITTLSTTILILFNIEKSLVNKLLAYKPIVYIGTLSFSIYMWHQVIVAMYRYAVNDKISLFVTILLLLIIFLLSIFSYKYIENYFRKEGNISLKKLLLICGAAFVITTVSSAYIYLNGGVVKDFPVLDMYKNNAIRNMNSQYNDRIYEYDNPFISDNKKKILIIGDSFARDWANILLESKYRSELEISYISDVKLMGDTQARLNDADVVFFSYYEGFFNKDFEDFSTRYKISSDFFVVGVKNFGINNGVFYNKTRDSNFCDQKTKVDKKTINDNLRMKQIWKDRYIDIMALFMDKNNNILIFTDECKFISQDCRHFTQNGTIFINKKIALKNYISK